MRHMGRLLPLFVLTLLIPSYALVAVADSGRAVNVDLDVTDISITYPDNANRSLYQMFSSNYPIQDSTSLRCCMSQTVLLVSN